MTVFRPNMMTLDGTPITGAAPVQVIVMEGELTPQLQAQLQSTYRIFCMEKLTAVGEFFIKHQVFPDGSRMRIESMQNNDRVFVWAPGGRSEEQKLAHGFAVRASWIDPQILGRAPKNKLWLKVPQMTDGVVAYNQIMLAAGDEIIVIPLVKVSESVWDFRRHANEAPGWLPFALKYVPEPTPPRLDLHPAHYSNGHVIADEDGNVLLTGTESEPVGLGNASSVTHPAFTDGKANRLGLQSSREEELGNKFHVSFASDKVKRVGAAVYAIEATTQNKFSVPYYPAMTSSVVAAADLGESAAEGLELIFIEGPGRFARYWGTYQLWDGLSWRVLSQTFVYFRHEVVEEPQSLPIIHVTDAFRLESADTRAPPAIIDDLVMVANAEAIEFIAWEHEVSYPTTRRLRGGWDNAEYTHDPFDVRTGAGYGTLVSTIRRADCDWEIVTPVRSTFDLRWCKINFFEGDVAGATKGSKYTGTLQRRFKRTSGATNVLNDPATTATVPPQQFIVDYDGDDPKYGDIVTIPDIYSPAIYSSGLQDKWIALDAEYKSNDGVKEVDGGYSPQINTIDYTLTSRHVIDYDHRGRFYAAIRVEVTCSGARWQHTPPDPLGTTRKTNDGTYTAKIYFESSWNGVVASQLLTEDSCTRPVFEAYEIRWSNPYYYPSVATELDILIRMPPAITPPIDAMRQLYTLAAHQGVNKHIACQDIEFLPPFDDPRHISETGIEFSYIRNSHEIPTKKYAPGCLYARVFKLSDVSDALWLLRHTQCDAPLNNNRNVEPPLPLWHYMPALGASIADDVFHIEVRDGVIGNWSQLLEGKTDPVTGVEATRPLDPEDLDIELYKV